MPRQLRQLPPDMTTLAREVADLRRDVRELRAARRLEHASISQGAITVTDPDGTVRAMFGHQDDGSVALVSVGGPVPPAPTDPVLTPQLAALDVTWDGQFAGGATEPADWMRCEVHVGATADFVPSQATLRTTIETGDGGTVTVPLPYTEWWVCLRSLTISGTASSPSANVAGTPRQAQTSDIAVGSITADQLDVDALNGKTITGSLIQTADEGAAIVLNQGGNNALEVYDDTNNVSIEIGSGPPAVITSYARGGENLSVKIAGGRIYLADDGEFSGDAGSITSETTGTLHIEGSSAPGNLSTPRLRFLPGNGTGTLELSSALGTASLTISGTLTVGGLPVPVPQAPIAPTYSAWTTPQNTSYQSLRLISDGARVFLDGSASTVTAFTGSQTAFTVPTALCPKKDHYLGLVRATSGDPRFIGCRIQASGTVTVYASTTVATTDTWDFSDISWSLN